MTAPRFAADPGRRVQVTRLTGKIVAQARTRLTEQTPESANRLVSLHDPDAPPIRRMAQRQAGAGGAIRAMSPL
jgi:hypothetical protein